MDDAIISNCHQFKNGALLYDGSMGPFKNHVNVRQIIIGILGIKSSKGKKNMSGPNLGSKS